MQPCFLPNCCERLPFLDQTNSVDARSFFHDYMSSFIDGSILHENNISMNVGLCRWTQYVAVLSDETRCDPGSIVAMAGQLGFEASEPDRPGRISLQCHMDNRL